MRRITSVLLLAAALGFGRAAGAQEAVLAFRGGTLYPISAAPIPNGVLVVQGGKILAIGAEGAVQIPAGATIHDVTGKTILPGLVDTHSHIGGGDGGDRSAALHPSVRILDAIDVNDDAIKRARAGGITTVNIMPGSGHLLSGQTAYLKLRHGRTINDLLLCNDVLREICGGIKMANGTNPRRDPPFPGTRARAAAMMRERFVKAQEYREKVRQAGRDASKLPARDLELEALAEVLDGRRMVHFHTHRHDDILTVLRLREEFGFRVVLQHVSDAWMVADQIAAAGVPSSIIMIDAPGGKLETMNISFTNGAALERAGAPVGFHTDDGITDSRWFLRSAGLAVRAGMSREKALEAMTLAGARMLDMGERIGSLERGKDADFVVLSGDPLSVYTLVEQTWIDGSKVFDRSNPRDRSYAVGGYGVFRSESMHVHAHEEDHR
jgi:imidazolonepropionase-like amidohydrolase